MHDWFAGPVATGRIEEMRGRADAHRLRVAAGADLRARATQPVLDAAARSVARLRQRRENATSATEELVRAA